jgi:RNA polymerase sigma factor (sigma-70 family)
MGILRAGTGGHTVETGDRADKAAVIEALSRRYRLALLRFFEKRTGRRAADVEDLVQDVFQRLAGDVNLESVERMEAYLFQTAANLLRDRHRRLTARSADAHEPYEEDVHGEMDGAPGPERAALDEEAIERLVAALYELPERTRAVFALYHFEDLPHAEIARRLGISVSTIEKHMGRANAYLLKKLDRQR